VNKEDFFSAMAETVTLRRMIVDYQLMTVTDPTHTGTLANALHGLKEAREQLDLDMSYEIEELEKDVLYLREGDEALFDFLGETNENFEKDVDSVIRYLDDFPTHVLVTDRDGTVNNYCARYRTSVQSVYNAVYLTLYARNRSRTPVVLTSAPLEPEGILEVMTTPRHTFIVAGSKGREFIDQQGRRHEVPIPEKHRRAMERLNTELEKTVRQRQYRRFTEIGSGLQKKFGQTAVSYQDVNGSIDPERAEAFRKKVIDLVRRQDPEGHILHIEDTGRDLEIILSAGDSPGEESPRDFDKADGVRFIDSEVPLRLAETPALVCGDTASDIPMMEHVAETSPDSRAILVTSDSGLIDRAKRAVPGVLPVSTPDSLVFAMGRLGRSAARGVA
jgi:hydroxymethylpyrimidine pyrophosphatase-like HAD family hydrolase